jgi:hypothetical protein
MCTGVYLHRAHLYRSVSGSRADTLRYMPFFRVALAPAIIAP